MGRKTAVADEWTHLLASTGPCSSPFRLDLQLKIMVIRWEIRDHKHLTASQHKAPADTHVCLNRNVHVGNGLEEWMYEGLTLTLDKRKEKKKTKTEQYQRDLRVGPFSLLLLQRRAHACYFALRMKKLTLDVSKQKPAVVFLLLKFKGMNNAQGILLFS